MPLTESKFCELCGVEYFRPSNNYSNTQWRNRRFCNRSCAASATAIKRFGTLYTPCACGCGKRTKHNYIKEHKPAWRGITTDGYIRLWRPGHPMASKSGFVLEHRFVVYEAGIEVPEGYAVHHKNKIHDDNRLENLEVKPHGQHTIDHLVERGYVTNQYGDWPIVRRTPEEQRRHERDWMREFRRKRREQGKC